MGSSFTKAVLLDLDSESVVAHCSRPSAQRIASEKLLRYEIPAKRLVENVKNLIDGFAAEYDDIAGVILSTQMHGFIYSVPGREDVYVSWQDMRCTEKLPGSGKSDLSYLSEQISKDDMEDNGVYLKPALAMCNLHAWFRQVPELPRNGRLYTLGSYIIWSLTGNNICHASNAAPLGLMDVRHRRWNRELIKKLEMEEIQLPHLAQEDFMCCGEYRSGQNLMRVYPDYGDMQVAALGSYIRQNDVFVNLGTGAQVIRFAECFQTGNYEVRPYFEHTYLNTISNMPGGRNLNVLIRFIQSVIAEVTGQSVSEAEIWSHIKANRAQEDSQLLVKTAFYQNPFFQDGGAIMGITQNNLSLGAIFAAAYRDMAQTYWHFIHELGGSADDICRIVCGGGVSWKNPELVQTIASVSLKQTVLSPIPEEALNGLYQISLVCAGRREKLLHGTMNTVKLKKER